MATSLTLRANEESTYIITAAFTDEDGVAVTPNTLTWTLTDADGIVINDREEEVIAPAASVDIVLQGADLALQSGESLQALRILTVEGTYDSDAGTDLPIKAACKFVVEDLVAIE